MSVTCIQMCESPIVGRWYAVNFYDSVYVTKDVTDLTVKFVCAGADIIGNMVRFPAEGTYTVEGSCNYGTSASVTVTAIGEPIIERRIKEVIAPNYEKLKDLLENNTYTRFIFQTDYFFQAGDGKNITVGEGNILDLNGYTFHYTVPLIAENVYSNMRIFEFKHDYSGMVNGKITCDNYEEYLAFNADSTYKEKMEIIQHSSGYCCEFRDLAFENVCGFNWGVGSYFNNWKQTTGSDIYGRTTRWQETNLTNGYYDPETGYLIENTEWWSSLDAIEFPETNNPEYYVERAQSGYFGVSTHAYNIYYYDADMQYLGCRENCQIYRVYKRPSETRFWQISINMEEAPANETTTNAILRISSAMEGYEDGWKPVMDAVYDRITCNRNYSGLFSFTGGYNDIHLSNIIALKAGDKNTWCADWEDGWELMVGTTCINSIFNAHTSILSGQAMCFANCYFWRIQVNYTPVNRVYVGCYFGDRVLVFDRIGSCTFINCYINTDDDRNISFETVNPWEASKFSRSIVSDAMTALQNLITSTI